MVPPSQQSSVLEITVLSADGLHHKSSSCSSTLFSLYFRRIRPFITLTKLPAAPTHGDRASHVYNSRVDDEGRFIPSWDQEFRIPVDSTFFSDQYSFIHLQLYNKRPIVGQAKLGSCLIPATDIGFLPPGSVRYLSYRLRSRDGSRGNGIINLSVKWDRVLPWMSPTLATCHTFIGIPVTALQGTSDCSSNPELETRERERLNSAVEREESLGGRVASIPRCRSHLIDGQMNQERLKRPSSCDWEIGTITWS